MPKFMLLIRGGDSEGLSPAQMEAIVAEYIAWARQMRQDGIMLDGDELSCEGAVVVGTPGGVSITDGPFAETKELVGGYFLIQAESLAVATEIAKQCPGLMRGGAVEVRPIVDHG